MFIIREKNSIKVVLKINSNKNENLEIVKNRIKSIADDFNISLDLDIKIDESVLNNQIKIEYYSRTSVTERIGDNYLKFLDKFLNLGSEKNISTYPMD